jgi:SAM-dependent methyltransferase
MSASASDPAAHTDSAFSAAWLRLREPADRSARATAAQDNVAWIDPLRRSSMRPQGAPLCVLDLGCGTGATLRWLAPRLGGVQRWLAFDDDEALLQSWPQAMAAGFPDAGAALEVTWHAERLRIVAAGLAVEADRQRLDLARQLEALPLTDVDLVCASAFIDLVSHAWLTRLVAHARAVHSRASFYFALAVDGRIDWHPALDGDAFVAGLFARHQQRDKGFGGAALGPAAPAAAQQLLADAGYAVDTMRSDWQLTGPDTQVLHEAFIEGMAAAAAEQEPAAAAAVEHWRVLRRAAVPGARLCVGHLDLVARPLWRSG